MKLLTWTSALPVLLYLSCANTELYRQSRQVSAGNQPGLCRYGRRLDCCYGWKRSSKGHCEAQCEHGCKYGECVGPNKCKCFPGYTGKTCNQDLNECGLKPRPCEHRCMNTHGSYMCYCLNGYMLMSDGSCANSRTCALAHCQYGCEEVQGEIRCLCPSAGLQLGPDQRTCVDIDECATRKNLCPYNRRCVNTFGSYFCKCQVGFDLKYINGKYDCADTDECAGESHRCSQHAVCINTQGSYRCKCKPGFRGNGTECTAIPEGPGKPPRNKLDSEQVRNAIPEAPVTAGSKVLLQPFDYDGDVYIGSPGEAEPKKHLPKEDEEEQEEEEEEQEEEQEENNQENQINSEELSSRGDVFFPKEFKSVFGPQTEVKQISVVPGREEFVLDCNFEQGTCEWVQDKSDDFDWNAAHSDKAGTGSYMAASAPAADRKALARLALLLGGRAQPGVFCLTFNYQLSGERPSALRVLLDNESYPVWEDRHGRGQAWHTELLTVAWEEEPPQSVIFEAEQGGGAGGEVGLGGVLLNSGSCQEHQSSVF